MNELTQARLNEVITYDRLSGVFKWNASKGRCKAGQIAGKISMRGYVHIQVDGKLYCAHRLAWLALYGAFPSDGIDHINGVKSDNRSANLRTASSRQNLQNIRAPYASSTSKVLGASFHTATSKWSASIRVAGKKKWIGLFGTKEEAGKAYLNEKRALHSFCTI